jgi:hypothetical protein
MKINEEEAARLKQGCRLVLGIYLVAINDPNDKSGRSALVTEVDKGLKKEEAQLLLTAAYDALRGAIEGTQQGEER